MRITVIVKIILWAISISTKMTTSFIVINIYIIWIYFPIYTNMFWLWIIINWWRCFLTNKSSSCISNACSSIWFISFICITIIFTNIGLAIISYFCCFLNASTAYTIPFSFLSSFHTFQKCMVALWNVHYKPDSSKYSMFKNSTLLEQDFLY